MIPFGHVIILFELNFNYFYNYLLKINALKLKFYVFNLDGQKTLKSICWYFADDIKQKYDNNFA